MDSFSSIYILGPDFYGLMFIFICYIIYWINRLYFMDCGSATSKKLNTKLVPMFTSNSLTRLGLQIYLTCGFAAMLNYQNIVAANFSDIISLIVAILCLLVFLLFPIFVGVILYKKMKQETWKKSDFNELYTE